jgi:creatinine amidohydrolase/Fe(II)-dependent formamide hydrolase-like protein
MKGLFAVVVIISTFLVNTVSYSPPLPAYELQYMTSPEVEQYVKTSMATRGCAPIILPIGATEQHGPSGLCGTDILTASAVAAEVAALNNCLLGPNLPVGMSLHHCDFAGSISLRPSTLASMICDIVHSLRQSSNITHFLFVNGHGGNMMALKYAKWLLQEETVSPWRMQQMLEDKKDLDKDLSLSAVSDVITSTPIPPTDSSTMLPGTEDNTTHNIPTTNNVITSVLNDALPPVKIDIISWYANTQSQTLARKLYGAELGQHATPDEVAVTQYAFPHAFEKPSGNIPSKGAQSAGVSGSESRSQSGRIRTHIHKSKVLLNPNNLLVAGRMGGMTRRRRERMDPPPPPTSTTPETTTTAATAAAITLIAAATTTTATAATTTSTTASAANSTVTAATVAPTTTTAPPPSPPNASPSAVAETAVPLQMTPDEITQRTAFEREQQGYNKKAMALTYMDSKDFKTRFPDGRMWSNPGLATPSHGKRLLETAVASVCQQYQAFIQPEQTLTPAPVPVAVPVAVAVPVPVAVADPIQAPTPEQTLAIAPVPKDFTSEPFQ